MNIRMALTDEEISACFPILRELRPHVEESGFVERIRDQERSGYRLAFVEEGSSVVAVAGFRVGENLAWGRFLYVDDLATSAEQRSRGYGAALLSWLRTLAETQGCAQLQLDSGFQRADAHRFYLREGMEKGGFHFMRALSPRKGT